MVLVKGKDQELFMRKPMISWTHLRTVSISAYPYAAKADLHCLFQNPARFASGDADQPEEKKGGNYHHGSLAKWPFFEGVADSLAHGGSLLDL